MDLFKAFGFTKDHDVNVPFNMPEDHHNDFIDSDAAMRGYTDFNMRFGEGPGAINASIVHNEEDKDFYIDTIARANVKEAEGTRQPLGLKPGLRLQSFLDKLSEANPDHTMSALAHDEKRARVYSRSGFNIEGRMEGSTHAGTGEPTRPEHQTHLMSRPSWNDLYKAFGIYKEDEGFGNPETWEGSGTPPHPRHGIFDQGWGSIPESRGTLVSAPLRNIPAASDRNLVHGDAFGYTPHEAAEEAHKVITSNPDRPMFYVGDDSHMVTLMAREDGKDGLEVRHSTHGGRANRHHADEINTKGPSPVTMGPRGMDLNYRDAVANHWIEHFKESPYVTQGLPLVGGLGLNRSRIKENQIPRKYRR